MLKVASFKISEDDSINALLSKYRLASGAHILVSDGQVCIPYEDGEPDNKDQQIVAIKEQKNTMLKELALVKHSQGVNDLQIADAKDQLKVTHAKWDANRSNKVLEATKNRIQARLDELQNLYLGNENEIVRLGRNIEMFDAEVAALN